MHYGCRYGSTVYRGEGWEKDLRTWFRIVIQLNSSRTCVNRAVLWR